MLIQVNDIMIDCEQRGFGEPVLMVMGSGASGRAWHAHQVPALVAGGYKVITFDNRGIGGTSGGDRDFSLRDMTDDVIGLAEKLNLGPCRMVGTSLGSQVLQEVALTRPDLISRMVLIATRGREDYTRQYLGDVILELYETGAEIPARYRAVTEALSNLSRHTLQDDVAARDWFEMFGQADKKDPGYVSQLRIRAGSRKPEEYGNIRTPTHVIAFEEDVITPPHLSEEIAAAIPGATFEIIPRCGHVGYLERPEPVNRSILAFLGGKARDEKRPGIGAAPRVAGTAGKRLGVQVSIVLIDNYDSFTYNLYQLLSMVAADDVKVVRNDDKKGWEEIQRDTLDAVVISPGPGRPEVPEDFGISRFGLEAGVPVLGVCLGLQGMCYAEGGTVDMAPEPYHGRRSSVIHDGSELFAGIPSPLRVVRYHSLVVSEVPPAFHVTAWTETQDGRRLVMAVRHRMRPVWGVQFHPESIFTEYGQRLVGNFVTLSGARRKPGHIAPSAFSVRTLPAGRAGTHRNGLPEAAETGRTDPASAGPDGQVRAEDGGMTLMWHEHQGIPDAEAAYDRLFAVDDRSFWLDSSAVIPGLSRMSVLGGAGPAAEYVTAVATKGVDVQAADGSTRHHDCSIFDYLESELRRRRIPSASLPFDFNLGYVGYLGYELKAECDGDAAHESDIPDAAFIFCDRAVVIDHKAERTYALTLVKNGAEECGRRWLSHALRVLAGAGTSARSPASTATSAEIDVTLRSSPAEYARLVRECMSEIRQGETYEVCLTNTITTRRPPDPWETYRDLRRRNPAPYGALLRFPDVQVLSASPERFLRIDRDGFVEAKPIKGTRPRGQTQDEDTAIAAGLRCSEKDQAENLMIVDLLRNDLGKVSETGSVHVPVIFDVETYATVHQLVSTVRSRLRAGVSPVACVRAAFPGGSMTGAPKRRTMQIIDRLEGASRGVYSGALGYFALSGTVDLSIVIRTIVVAGESARVGAGGAVVALSDPDDEVAEMQLKARASLDALRATADASAVRCVTASDGPSHPAADQTPSGLPFTPWPGKDYRKASR